MAWKPIDDYKKGAGIPPPEGNRIMADEVRQLSEFERLELEEKRYRVENMRLDSEKRKEAKANAERQRKQVIADMKLSETKIRQKQEACTHRKGGKNLEGLTYGNDQNYSIIRHTYPNNETWVLCQRCGKEWKPGEEVYLEAIRFPTDNEPSGSVTFSNLQTAV